MITLYYIRGLTRLDEPVFDTLENQTTFFNNHKIVAIDTGFYPPHYRNEIMLSIDDVKLQHDINYLSLEYDSKVFYYFIDKVEYVSEDVIRLIVTMDVIQTYMFNMKFNDSVITKQSISRWIKEEDEYYINRDYTRENLSHEDFETVEYKKTKDSINWIVIWMRDATNVYIDSSASTLLPTRNNFKVYSTINTRKPLYTIYKTPVFIPISTVAGFPYVTIDDMSTDANLTNLVDMTGILSIQYIPYDILKDEYTYTRADSTIKLVFNTSRLSTSMIYTKVKVDGKETIGMVSAGVYPYIKSGSSFQVGSIVVPYLSNDIGSAYLQFKVNHSTTAAFNNDYVPALCDENYLQVEYGEQMNVTAYPLSQLKQTYLYANVIYDVESNSRMYYISDDTYSIGVAYDKYSTLIVCNSIESIEQYTNAWNEYYSRNTGTWTLGYALSKQKILFKGITDSVSNIITTAGSAVGSFMNSNEGGMVSSISKGVANEYSIISNAIEDRYVLDENRKITKQNLEYTPDTEKQGNTYTADIIDGAFNRVFRLKRVRDYAWIGYELELGGYKCNKHVDKTDLLHQNIRYYYDIIQADVLNMYIADYITDEETMYNIKMRFAKGLRLWHCNNGTLRAGYIGNFTYDNVETSFIEEDN